MILICLDEAPSRYFHRNFHGKKTDLQGKYQQNQQPDFRSAPGVLSFYSWTGNPGVINISHISPPVSGVEHIRNASRNQCSAHHLRADFHRVRFTKIVGTHRRGGPLIFQHSGAVRRVQYFRADLWPKCPLAWRFRWEQPNLWVVDLSGQKRRMRAEFSS